MKTLLVVVIALAGCATTTPTVTAVAPPDPTSPEAARETVRAALAALKSGDEEAFRAQLTAQRDRDFTEAWFQIWTAELQPARSWDVGAFEGEGDAGRVRVVLDLGRTKQEASIRVKLEGGRWRWAEN